MTVYNVATAGELQTAITACTYGDTIQLVAAGVFENTGLVLPDKGAGSDYITITMQGSIPSFLDSYPESYVNGVYTRVTTAMAATMPKVLTTADQPVIAFANDAHHWKVAGLELSNNTPDQTIQQLVGTNLRNHHLWLENCWLHPQEENGTDNNIEERSINQAIIANGDNITIVKNAITGFTGYSYGFTFRLEASCILSSYLADSLIEHNLCEVNGQLFIGGGGGIDPAHTANTVGTSTFTAATLDSTTDLAVDDMLAIHNLTYASNHLAPNSQSTPTDYTPVSSYQNGRIETINSGTGAVTFSHLTSGLNYRQFLLYRFQATGGSYTLTWMGQTTAPIAWNATKSGIRSALEALSNVTAQDFQIRDNGADGWPYSDFMINFNKGEDNNPGAWSYPTPINPLVITSSLTGGNAPGYVGAYAAESYSPSENSQDGTSWIDVPQAGDDVAWNGTQAHDVTVRRNIFAKRHVWTAATGDVKGFVEQKECIAAIYDANIFTGRATGFVFTVRNQGGALPWASNSYTQFTNNLWDEGGGTFAIANSDGAYELQEESHDLLISNNIVLWPGGFFEEVTNKYFSLLTGGYNITINHNTGFVNFYILLGVSFIPVASGTLVVNNIFRWQGYPAPCTDGPGPCWVSADVSNNLLYNQKGADSSGWYATFGAESAWEESTSPFIAESAAVDPAGDSMLQIGDGSNYRVEPGSRYAAGGDRDATDGKALGVEFDALITALGYDPFAGSSAQAAVVVSGLVAFSGEVVVG